MIDRMPSLVMGSSPRLRGTREPGNDSPNTRGLIPATAGNAPAGSLPGSNQGAHPRDCGERNTALTLGDAFVGSSPRLRGTPIP